MILWFSYSSNKIESIAKNTLTYNYLSNMIKIIHHPAGFNINYRYRSSKGTNPVFEPGDDLVGLIIRIWG
jgi:hypothetical protein